MKIYDIVERKQKKMIPELDVEVDYTAKEFLSCAFCPKNERAHILTLTGEPDWQLQLWDIDLFKVVQSVNLHVTDLTYDTWTF